MFSHRLQASVAHFADTGVYLLHTPRVPFYICRLLSFGIYDDSYHALKQAYVIDDSYNGMHEDSLWAEPEC